jgi:hypothetical protein
MVDGIRAQGGGMLMEQKISIPPNRPRYMFHALIHIGENYNISKPLTNNSDTTYGIRVCHHDLSPCHCGFPPRTCHCGPATSPLPHHPTHGFHVILNIIIWEKKIFFFFFFKILKNAYFQEMFFGHPSTLSLNLC